MKRILLSLLVFCFACQLTAQENFRWEIIDSIPKTKEQLYTETKLFIADYWKAAQKVIQNDDKEGGIIVVKGLTCCTKTQFLASYTYCYDYTVTIMIKDQKFRFIIDDVFFNDQASDAVMHVKKASDTPPDLGDMKIGVTKNWGYEIMGYIKSDLQYIADSFTDYIRKNNITDW